MSTHDTIWVMHAGALGDWVLVWPLLRTLARGGATVVAVAHDSKGKLAAKWLDAPSGRIVALPGGIDQPRFSRWWAGPDEHTNTSPDAHRPNRVITFLCDDSTPAGQQWIRAARAEFPDAIIQCIGAPGSASRAELWRQEEVTQRGQVAARHNPHRPVVCHVGAGSPGKRWPMARWSELAADFRTRGIETAFLAGEVEHERFDANERAAFASLGGAFTDALDDLATRIASARLFIGADTGPTHLAAQLGVPTLALFGPTDPAVWSPVGPVVRILAPQSPASLDWLSPGAVLTAACDLYAYTSHP